MLQGLERVMLEERPDAVLVYGDTNSTLAGALAAAKLHLPVIHVEAGLRSFNRRMPEEINRVVADHLSAILFCPTHEAVMNLTTEGITEGVHRVGDVMYDATLFAREKIQGQPALLERLGLAARSYALCTLHRAENTDDGERFARLIDYLESEAREQPIVFPVHPRTRERLHNGRKLGSNLILLDPVGYFDMQQLVAGAVQIFTDSGGLQKEAYFHRVPCVTLRDETEWVETLEAGWNRLWTTPDYRPRRDIAEYGNGDAAKRVATITASFLT
jgi:UDP-GlcNAc3NAcA epimerase